jgi:hypothetical protein
MEIYNQLVVFEAFEHGPAGLMGNAGRTGVRSKICVSCPLSDH